MTMTIKSKGRIACAFLFLLAFSSVAYPRLPKAPSIHSATHDSSNSKINIRQVARFAIQRRLNKNDNDTLKTIRSEKWDWGAGVLMFGMMHAFYQTEDESLFRFMNQWINLHTEKNDFKISHTDEVAPAAIIADMMVKGFLKKNDKIFRGVLDETFNFLTEAIPKTLKGCEDENGRRKEVQLQWRGRTWLDDLFMTSPFMIRYCELTGDSTLYTKIAKHFLAHRDFSQCHRENSYLMKHGNYLYKDYKLLFWMPSGNVAWARGNGWYIAALADFLAKLPKQHSMHFEMLKLYQNIIDEISTHQLESGLFPTVLDDHESYGEVSATALFVFATAIGLQKNWLGGEQNYKLVQNGISGILKNIDEMGQISGTSTGTGVFPSAVFYKIMKRGTYPWGEGSVLMAFAETIKLVDGLEQKRVWLNNNSKKIPAYEEEFLRTIQIFN